MKVKFVDKILTINVQAKPTHIGSRIQRILTIIPMIFHTRNSIRSKSMFKDICIQVKQVMKGNVQELFTVIAYYTTVWKNETLDNLNEIFSDDIVLNYYASDEPCKDFVIKGKKEVVEWYQKWATYADRHHTFIEKLCLRNLSGGHYLTTYNINQSHNRKPIDLRNAPYGACIPRLPSMYNFRAQELFVLRNGKISDICMTRLSKREFFH